ncbi:ArsR family transcriptional regulator [Blastococcus sp. MG754426]|uniref:helix-turn-helix domain-containing protein n=1 Tax=unclassified Blastococcus TaxID=2619396 RepID=UPI001EF0C540|nr:MULTISPECIES: helix-turn-helix domain-containing protein [unclassified Blastococcus]MCF6508787.1 ArsR family transcriptional regulator [Blastococcus sp. MG754426]MCF6513425.1 ArsR family transcriptional regulator [Blastococcus sp. MG754427]MCF6736063.1 ArsR family transcriptional regulator [Blastococcus sp. KM273129]
MAVPPDPARLPTGAVRVTDVDALRVLAHPLRSSLLGALRVDGPSTASRLAERFGESSGSTSYHLRQLARHGFVAELPDEGNARDRWWQALHRRTSWDTADLAGDPAGRELVEEVLHRQLSQQRRRLDAHASQFESLDTEWRDATSLSDWSLRLSPAAARQLADELNDVVRRWQETREEPDQPAVTLLLDLLPPVREHPL